ncbi:AAA family ATPase [Lacipirellula sp.]|uniref:AAA family ATPase n=1 Tax=Lacipirellula sp. TaxID=2691419 RepID=UPI003D1535C3
MIAQATQHEILPRALDAEQQAVGSVLIEPDRAAEVLRYVRPGEFFHPLHRAAMFTIVNMQRDGLPVDIVIVSQQLAKRPEFKGESATAYLGETGRSVVSGANAVYHAKLVAEANRKRQIHLKARDIAAAALNGESASELFTDLSAFVDDFRRVVGNGTEELPSHTLAEFIRLDHRQNFLIDGVVTEAQPGVWSAKSKSLKTTTAVAASIALATGRPFLGQYEVPEPQPCGIISAESGGATLSESYERICADMGVWPSAIDNLHISTEMPLLTTPEGRDQLERWIEKYGLRAVWIDPTYQAFAGVDDTQLMQMALHLLPLSKIVDRQRCSIIAVHHNKKTPRAGDYYAEPTMDDIQGSGFQQWARFFVMLGRRREWEPTTGQHWLWFRTEGSAGFGSRYHLNLTEGRRSDPGGRIWQLQLCDPQENVELEQAEATATKESNKLSNERAAVCAVLVQYPDGLSWTKALRLSGVSERRWKVVRETMLDEGDVEECQVVLGNRKTPVDGIKLTSTEAT